MHQIAQAATKKGAQKNERSNSDCNNGRFIRIEQKTDINLDNVLVSAGTNIDALMDYFKHHTSEVYQRVIEKEFHDAIPTDYIDQ